MAPWQKDVLAGMLSFCRYCNILHEKVDKAKSAKSDRQGGKIKRERKARSK